MEATVTIEELQRQVRQLKKYKGFDITLEQRLAYLISEVGEVASEVLKLSRDGNKDAGEMSAAESAFAVANLGVGIQRAVEPVRFSELGESLREEGGSQRGQEMVGAV